MVAHDVLVAVPVRADFLRRGVFRAAEDLHEAHAALDEPAGEQALAAERADVLVIELVELLRGRRFRRADRSLRAR